MHIQYKQLAIEFAGPRNQMVYHLVRETFFSRTIIRLSEEPCLDGKLRNDCHSHIGATFVGMPPSRLADRSISDQVTAIAL